MTRPPERRPPPTSAALRLLTVLLVPFTVLLAVYITAHGHLTPGGGFQGGVIGATALLLVYIGGEYMALRRVRPLTLVEVAKASGAGAFVLIGIGGILFAAAFLDNFLPVRPPGELSRPGRSRCSASPWALRSPAASCCCSRSSSTSS